ncbi:hypothetical protein L2E82_51429 [Cichorium intybus]|nr:hypothetical protein L2E82_51429 [Cichorium intybus]
MMTSIGFQSSSYYKPWHMLFWGKLWSEVRGEIEMLEDSIIMKEQKFYDSDASDLVCGEDNGDKLDESRAWWKLESDSDVATL